MSYEEILNLNLDYHSMTYEEILNLQMKLKNIDSSLLDHRHKVDSLYQILRGIVSYYCNMILGNLFTPEEQAAIKPNLDAANTHIAEVHAEVLRRRRAMQVPS